MVFSSIQFLFYFLPIFLFMYYVSPFKNIVLVIASIVFYAWGEPSFVPVLVVFIIVNFVAGLWVERAGRWRGAVLTAGVGANLGLLVYFKYFNFVLDQASAIASAAGVSPLEWSRVALPLGISFIAFQGISYVVDVYRGDVRPQRSLLNFAMYKSMFPQLIAGPIVRYSHICAQVERRPTPLHRVYRGARQFLVGLVQKVLVANTVALPADQVFKLPAGELTASTAWLGIACYTLQIYFDFAGYSNMAIGLGHMVGFRYPINFNRPYAAQSITEFWRRWHISLSRWFRDYLYIPLGGNRGTALQCYRNLLIVFVLCGFWHGASWTFVVWGAYHGSFLIIERLGVGRLLDRLWQPLRHVYLMLVVMVGWVIFRADTLAYAGSYVAAMAGFGRGDPVLTPMAPYATNSAFVALAFGAIFAIVPRAIWRRVARWASSASFGAGMQPVADAALVALAVMSAVSLAGGAHNPFIYFRF